MSITWFSTKFIAKILDNSFVSFSFHQNEDAGNALWENVLHMRNAVIPLAPPEVDVFAIWCESGWTRGINSHIVGNGSGELLRLQCGCVNNPTSWVSYSFS